jgi:hypothetical protein
MKMTLPLKIKELVNYDLCDFLWHNRMFKLKDIEDLGNSYKKEIYNTSKNGINMYNDTNFMIYKSGIINDIIRYYINYKHKKIIIIEYDIDKNILIDPLYSFVEDNNRYALGVKINFNNIKFIFRLLGTIEVLQRNKINDIKLLEIFSKEHKTIYNVYDDLDRFKKGLYYRNIKSLSYILTLSSQLDQPNIFTEVTNEIIDYLIENNEIITENNRYNIYRNIEDNEATYHIIIGNYICSFIVNDEMIDIVTGYSDDDGIISAKSIIGIDKSQNRYNGFMRLLYYELRHYMNVTIKFSELCYLFIDEIEYVDELYKYMLCYENIISNILKPYVISDIINKHIMDYMI